MLIRDGEKGEREIIYLSLHCHHQNVFCIKTGSDESHFNVSLIVRDKVTIQCPSTDHNFRRERRAEADSNRGPSAYQPNALPLGQTGSQSLASRISVITPGLQRLKPDAVEAEPRVFHEWWSLRSPAGNLKPRCGNRRRRHLGSGSWLGGLLWENNRFDRPEAYKGSGPS